MATSENESGKMARSLARKRVQFITELLRLNLDGSISEQGAIRSRQLILAREQLEEIKEILMRHPDLKLSRKSGNLEKSEARLALLEEMAGLTTPTE